MGPEQQNSTSYGIPGEDSAPSGGPREHRPLARPSDAALGRSLALVRFLRRSCPWDARQDPASLRPYLLEEAAEVADAILEEDDRALSSELGDLLLNVAFQIVLAEEREAFDAPAVVAELETKMRTRHPHVYGDAGEPPDWEEMKSREREDAGERFFAGIAASLEPLARAFRTQERAAGVGFDWPDLEGPLAKVREELGELETELGEPAGDGRRVEEELGDLLFACVNLARRAGLHPSNALARAVTAFQRRFERTLELAEAAGTPVGEASLEELDALWERAKREEARG